MNLLPNCLGYGIGLFLKEQHLSITETNDEIIKEGMCFHIRITLQDFHSKKERNALILADTVFVEST